MYDDLDRPPLDARRLAVAATRIAPWRELRVVGTVGSTNDVVAAEARAGAAEGLVVVAEYQAGGRGRLDRRWVSPPQAGLTMSLLLRPPVPVAARGWLPLLAGVAVARAASERADVDVALKWPNDLLVAGRKLGGLLAEVAGDAVVVGIGLNVSTRRAELPRADATSLVLEARQAVDRGPLLLAVLRAFGSSYVEWAAAGGAVDAVRAAYVERCDTLGRAVRVALPDGSTLAGEAVDIDESGRLVVRAASGTTTAVSAGDVVHVLPTS